MPLLQNARETALTVGLDVRDFVKSKARGERPSLNADQQRLLSDVRRDGIAVMEGYWPRERALAMRDTLERYLEANESTDYDGGAYLRVWDGRAYDTGVRRIYHVDKLETELKEPRFDPFVLDIATAYYGTRFHSGALVFQHNLQSNANTRTYHVDAFTKEFKAFIYLDDVDEGNGPFAYVKGTHKSHGRRLRKQIKGNEESADTTFYPEDLGPLLNDEVNITGPAGTMILADVRGFHRGTPQVDRSRSVLVNYIVHDEGDLPLDR
jgi:hypothetical protein